MATYTTRTCSKRLDYLGVIVKQTPKSNGEHPINAFCAVCGYQLTAWRLIVGRTRMTPVDHGRMPELFS